jgi:Zn-dependent protease/CBS domain-containing protein
MPQNERPTKPAPNSPWSLNLGQVVGIPIRIHFTFFILLAWVAFEGYSHRGVAPVSSIVTVIGLFTCVILHELGHSVVAQRYGIPVTEIILYPIGGVAKLGAEPKPPQELWIALAGPAVNVVIAGGIAIGLAVTKALTGDVPTNVFGGDIWRNLLVANIMLAVFNMIPAFPMDGGRVLRAILAMRLGDVRGTEIAARIGQFCAFGLGFLGLFGNSPMLVFIAVLVFLVAGQENAATKSRAMTAGHLAGEAMITDFRTLTSGSTLRHAAEMLLDTSQQDFPVLNGEQVIGLLSRQNLLRGLATSGPDAYVAEAMIRDIYIIEPTADLLKVAEYLQTERITCAIVLDGEKILGLVTMENVAEFLILQQLMEHKRAAPVRGSVPPSF